MTRAGARLGVVLAVALGGAAAPAWAFEDEPARPINGDSLCPRPEAVTQALGAVGAEWHELAARLPGGGPLALITDLGGGFRVTMLGRSRDYVDARRDCDERARMAAVVVALMVDALAPSPEERELRPPPAVPPPPAPSPPPPSPPAPAARGLTLELAGEIAEGAAPRGDRFLGGRAGLSFTLGPLALVATVGAAIPHVLEIGPVRAHMLRFPGTLSARLGGRLGSVYLAAELGGAAALSVIENENPATRVRRTYSELGVHGGVVARFAARRRLSPVAGLSADFFPVSPAYVADPLGDIGHPPRLWARAWLGAAFDLL